MVDRQRARWLSVALLTIAGGQACLESKPQYVDVRREDSLLKLTGVTENNIRYRRPSCEVKGSYRSPQMALADNSLQLLGSSALSELSAKLPKQVDVNLVEGQVFTSPSGTLHADVSFSVDGVDLCQYAGKLHVNGSESSFRGSFPPMDLPEAAKIEWRETPAVWLEQAASKLNLSPKQITHYRSERCLYLEDKALVPAWRLSAYFDLEPFDALVSTGKVYEVYSRSFRLTASAQVYKYGSEELVTIELPNMQSTGFLCNDFVTTRVPANRPMAQSDELKFVYPPSDIRFKEVSAFTSVAKMWEWFLAKSPSNWAASPIEIVLTDDPLRISGGPVYENPDIGSVVRPTIYAPDMVGNVSRQSYSLTNIDTDFDALAHELGHHIIFQFVGLDSSLEHKALHEAIADFFVMAKTSDPCLAETICTPDSSICAPGNKCLRSADNNFVFGGASYDELGSSHHKKSQLISGLLWDLNKKQAIPLAEVGDLVFEAIHYMHRRTSFQDFLTALLAADKSRTKKANACKIVAAAKDRGFSEHLKALDCKNY